MMVNADNRDDHEEGLENPVFEGDILATAQHPPEAFAPSNNNVKSDREDTSSGRPNVAQFAVEDLDDGDNHQCTLLCGLVPLRWCKVFLTAQWILVFLCWASTIQGMVVNGFVNVVITTLERRFGLRSSQTGIIAGCYDLGSMISVIPISYFGGRLGTSKPRYISLGLFFMGCGSLLFSLPHFLTDLYISRDEAAKLVEDDFEVSVNKGLLCGVADGASEMMQCQDVNNLVSDLSGYRYLFMAGQILHGIGAAPLITLGTTLLDESVKKKNSPMYIGILQTTFVIGPAIGFLLGGSLLDVYTDFDLLPDGATVLSKDSPLWVGAWWVGFCLTWILAWSCAIVIGMYPPVLPGAAKHNEVSHSDGFMGLRELPKAIKALLLNPTYMFINVGGAMDGFSVAGLSTFMPKFFQSVYGLSPSAAAILVGAMVVPAGGGGTFLGGFFTKRLRLNRTSVIRMYMWCQFVTVPTCLAFLLYCTNEPFAGISQPYAPGTGSEVTQNLSAECNAGCGPCIVRDASSGFDPVCGADGRSYFNPCFAGCKSVRQYGAKDSKLIRYTSCACVEGNSWSVRGSCTADENCSVKMYGFIAGGFIIVFFTFLSTMPNVVATLRAVEPVHRSLALGIESIILRLLGTIPGPVVFGYLIDHTCQLWQQEVGQISGSSFVPATGTSSSCSSSSSSGESGGSCLLYDNRNMSINLLVVLMSVKALAVASFAAALYYSKRSQIKEEND